MNQRMLGDDFDAVLRDLWSDELSRDTHGDMLTALRHEAVRARREEIQQQDRIHALEVQQAELIRQVKELKEALVSAGSAALTEARTKILATAEHPRFFSDYRGESYDAAICGWGAGVNHALDTLAAMGAEVKP